MYEISRGTLLTSNILRRFYLKNTRNFEEHKFVYLKIYEVNFWEYNHEIDMYKLHLYTTPDNRGGSRRHVVLT